MGVRVESAFYEKSKFWVSTTYEKSKYNCRNALKIYAQMTIE